MLLAKERDLIVAYGRKLIQSKLTTGTGGNISIYNPEEGLVAISPSGIDYFEITPGDVPVVDLEKNVLDGQKNPSSEIDMHLIFYANRNDMCALVHTHSLYATVLSCMKKDLPALHYLVGFAGVDVRCAEYATFGTPALAAAAYAGMQDRKAVLLANHGMIAGGADIAESFGVAEMIEFCSQLYVKALSVGEPVILPEEEMNIIMEKFKSYGKQN